MRKWKEGMRVKLCYMKEQEEGDEVKQVGGSGQRHSVVTRLRPWCDKLWGITEAVWAGRQCASRSKWDKVETWLERKSQEAQRWLLWQPSSYGEHWFKKKKQHLEKDVMDNYWYRMRFKDSFFPGTFSIQTKTKGSHHGHWNLQILPSG